MSTSVGSIINADAKAAEQYVSRTPRTARTLIAVLVAVVIAFAVGRCSRGSSDDTSAVTATRDSLVATAVHEAAAMRTLTLERDSLRVSDSTQRAQLAAVTARADARDASHPVPRLAFARLTPGTQTPPPNGTAAATTPRSPGGDSGSHTGSPIAPLATVASVPVDTSWRVVTIAPDTSPHYVDGVIASTLGHLDSLGVEYAAYRVQTRQVLLADSATIQNAYALAATALAKAATADSITTLTERLIPSRWQRLRHDALVVAGTVAVYAIVDNVLNVVRVAATDGGASRARDLPGGVGLARFGQ